MSQFGNYNNNCYICDVVCELVT